MEKEIKAIPVDEKADYGALMQTFETYKQVNDQRLNQLENKGQADPLLDQKLAKIDQRIDQLSLKMARPDTAPTTVEDVAQNTAWQAYLRHGDSQALAAIDVKSLHTGEGTQGGYVVPPELDRLIEARLMQTSALRQIATVRQTNAGVYRKPISLGAEARWIGEIERRTETTLTGLELLEFPAGELYAMPAASQTLLDDAFADIDDWLAGEVETAFSAQESAAFVTGDGDNKPKGFLDYEIVAETNHTWGQIGSVAGDFTQADAGDQLIDLIHTPKRRFRQNGRFVLNRRTAAIIRKMKDSEGRYLWAPSQSSGGATILGFPLTEIEEMPDIGDGQAAIGFGDFRQFYLITDRQGARVLRDPYSAKPFVLFYTTKRVGGGVQNFDAVKMMVF